MGKDFFCPKKDKWFIESSVPYDTSEIKIGTKVKKRLYSGKSPFQKVEVLDTYGFGRVLVLDGILGPKTTDSIKKWQVENGLVADGLVGDKTKAKINITE